MPIARSLKNHHVKDDGCPAWRRRQKLPALFLPVVQLREKYKVSSGMFCQARFRHERRCDSFVIRRQPHW